MRRSDAVEESAGTPDQLRLERRKVLGVRDVRQVAFTCKIKMSLSSLDTDWIPKDMLLLKTLTDDWPT